MIENAVICAMPREDSRVRTLNWPCGQASSGTFLDRSWDSRLERESHDAADQKSKGGEPGRLASFVFPLRGKSGKPDGGRPAGRVLACQ